jgi:hypothetical protein
MGEKNPKSCHSATEDAQGGGPSMHQSAWERREAQIKEDISLSLSVSA